ncbi:MAG: hypothetical protein PHN33_05395, partial [Candidatus Peribacteraceae bacterium]|nr:hypothetical protein [Candidatus Peribacteraceae bacterium]
MKLAIAPTTTCNTLLQNRAQIVSTNHAAVWSNTVSDTITCAQSGSSSSPSSSSSSSSSSSVASSSSSAITYKDCAGPNGTIISVPVSQMCPTFSSSSSSSSSSIPAYSSSSSSSSSSVASSSSSAITYKDCAGPNGTIISVPVSQMCPTFSSSSSSSSSSAASSLDPIILDNAQCGDASVAQYPWSCQTALDGTQRSTFSIVGSEAERQSNWFTSHEAAAVGGSSTLHFPHFDSHTEDTSARWFIPLGLPGGLYHVYATWVPAWYLGKTVNFTLKSGTNSLLSGSVDQTSAPADAAADGRQWKKLFTQPVRIAPGQDLRQWRVEIAPTSNQEIMKADAVMLIRIGD